MKNAFLIALILIACVTGSVWADDTEIYGTVTNPDLEANILIIFDSSGSMSTVDVPGDPYVPSTVYTGSYITNAVYERYWSWSSWSYQWRLFANDVNDLNCTWIKDDLLDQGYAYGRIYSASYACGGSLRRLRTGNFMNYDESGVGTLKSRIEVAQQVVTDLINNTTGVRFGLMKFNEDQGGQLIAPCGTDQATLTTEVANITADGWTPLAETLAEAGLYFAGMESWYNSGVSYTSPMQERCQKNYIIIMTDGQSTKDIDFRLTDANYINGDKIGDYDNDHTGDEHDYSDNGSDYLDDVAKYLYENDCNPTLGDGTAFDKQNIVTYTIGFKTSQQLLQNTAANGGGEYFTADNISELAMAFDQILMAISQENAVFVAPVVPISRMNRAYAGNKIYLGFFKPQQSGRWIGNIKRYGLDEEGTIYDATPPEFSVEACTEDGLIKANALSYWTTLGADGADVEKGGAAEVLSLRIENGIPRNLYTYTGGATALTDENNAFVVSNSNITYQNLDVGSDAERQSLINSIHNAGLGDIIHSEPAVVYYPNSGKTIIYVGSNDGLLHAFDDDDGSEVWGFIPPDQLSRLKLLDNADHDYFVDGSPSIFYRDQNHDGYTDQIILIMGERRGGNHYFALDITTYNAPIWLYSIGPDVLDRNEPEPYTYEALGQSWSKPTPGKVFPGAFSQDAFIVSGGYDNNQDLETPNATDSVGRAVFAVRAMDGQIISGLNFNAIDHPALGMTHSIVDLTVLSYPVDDAVFQIYAGDLGGNVFAFRDVGGTWTATKLFSASAVDGVQRKIFYAPDVTGHSWGEYIFFGTGDRADPDKTTVVNRFYAVKNTWDGAGVLTETDLVDVTDDLIQLGTEAQKQAVQTSLENGKGWYIRLENPGEKVLAAPRVYGGVAYFSTYTPDSSGGGGGTDPCATSTVRGVARLYALDYQTGASRHMWNSEEEVDGDGEIVELGKKDRSIEIGTAIPSAPVIAIFERATQIFQGIEGGVASHEAIQTRDMHRFYWHQRF